MRNNKHWGILFLTLFTFVLEGKTQNIWDGYEHLFLPAKQQIAYKTNETIVIDGNADEKSWQLALWSDDFEDIRGEIPPDPTTLTGFKVLWDDETLYIFAELKEPHIRTFSNTEQIEGRENDFEIFIDPDNDTHDYYEFEINANNKVTDRFMALPRRNGGTPSWVWNIRNLKSAVSIYGTLNNPSDTDLLWTIEMAIPFRSLTTTDQYEVPENLDYWKINFARVQWPIDIINGRYYKKKDQRTRQLLPKQIWAWSPQYAGNMHHPEQWGLITFSDKLVGTTTVSQKTPIEEKYSNYLWFLYYKQFEYRKKHLEYAHNLSDLGMTPVNKTHQGEPFLYGMEVKGHTFNLYLSTKSRVKLRINQDGHFSVVE